MNYILDTHILIWWLENPQKLSKNMRRIIEDPQNTIYVSSVVTWEIAVKASLGKLIIPDEIFEVIRNSGFEELSVTVGHTQTLATLPLHHTDPFDRLLISQAIHEGFRMISVDDKFNLYDLRIET